MNGDVHVKKNYFVLIALCTETSTIVLSGWPLISTVIGVAI